ncbi:protein LOL2-like isoform X2 [Tasmannia lanceolata]|uniref:protein LOL2-like isoform X2 n=1 Tax=Tasmannia lanceolata TaxID=3420 RepID=UPI0040627F1F
MGQMVCGNCHHLLSYPQGARNVQCSSCQIVNLVLEAHQVGNVKCGGCSMLLMYPYGAPSVRCSSCQFVTEIGAHNMRPPLSVQQGQPPPSHNAVQ